ncbi:MAG: hypothetical protein M0R77_10350 [Gammaproteobacteria bacterium]|nr:hypothetical protein [Gammaproteobacteria bacterium]
MLTFVFIFTAVVIGSLALSYLLPLLNIADTLETELKSSPTPALPDLWTAADDQREKELYLENPSAFWLNPNRYGANGEYDLLAAPYVEKKVASVPGLLGKWEYVKPTSPKPTYIRK